MAQGFSLKDQLFNAEKVAFLAGLFGDASAGFDAPAFERHVMSGLLERELKERIAWIAACLGHALPGTLPEVAPILRAAMPPPLNPTRNDDDFGDFIFAPLGDFVVNKGLEDHATLSLDLFEDITQRFSMEWSVRPFLNRWPDQTMARMMDWTQHPSTHVRRLVSEGTRPRLPWGQSVGLALGDSLGLLDGLHSDKTRYVTRSVANHLNDITKKDPDLAMDRLDAWAKAARQDKEELDWMTRHALRGLIKAGNPRSMKMLGYDPDMAVKVQVTLAKGPVQIGDFLAFSCEVFAPRDSPVLVDYVIHFQRPGGRFSPKVFKLKQTVARGRAPLTLTKRHRLKGDATTFKLVPGPHRLDIQVNGVVRASVEFDLLNSALLL
jgi:3-methyladenine DNA glycosylase AlkC